jgi:16S rRNA pseudouridine516 synthase
MTSRYGRLDRLLARQLVVSRGQVKPLLASGRVLLNQEVARHADARVGPFDSVSVDGAVLQQGMARRYLMLHKPAGIVSATSDPQHRTVMDLVRDSRFAAMADALHIAGRLDATSTGLMLLTNDGQWSRTLCDPANGLAKYYRVDLARPVTEADVRAFADGMAFPYEGITTRPAGLQPLPGCRARVTLVEGRYHQVRRMFARCGNQVLALHREAIGPWSLPDDLLPGQVRALADPEQLFHAAARPDPDTGAYEQ